MRENGIPGGECTEASLTMSRAESSAFRSSAMSATRKTLSSDVMLLPLVLSRLRAVLPVKKLGQEELQIGGILQKMVWGQDSCSNSFHLNPDL